MAWPPVRVCDAVRLVCPSPPAPLPELCAPLRFDDQDGERGARAGGDILGGARLWLGGEVVAVDAEGVDDHDPRTADGLA